MTIAGAVIGAAIDDGVQVYHNYQSNGGNLSAAMTTNIDWVSIGKSALIGAAVGATVAVAAPAVIAAAGDVLTGTALLTGSTTLFGAGMTAYQTATVMQNGLMGASSAINAVCADGDCTNEVPPTYVFWSGGDLAKNAAQTWAKENNGLTLEMTQAGQSLEQATKSLDWATQARPMWINASRDFASSATGEVHVFQNAAGVAVRSIWATVEYPALINNPNVSGIVYHVVMPDGTVIIPK